MSGILGLFVPGGGATPQSQNTLHSRLLQMYPDRVRKDYSDRQIWLDEERGVAIGCYDAEGVGGISEQFQPALSRDERWAGLFWGAIYNHREQRQLLERKGVHLRDGTYTEILVETIAQRGLPDALTDIDGAFVTAVWDRRERILHLIRDRMGEKPLFYGRVGRTVVFASELSIIRRLPGVATSPDLLATAEFLRFGFVPAPLSILPGIRKLSPGCVVSVDSRGGLSEPEPFWSLLDVARAGVADRLSLQDAELVDIAEQQVTESLVRRFEAETPVGVFLSGGLDSSTIAALAQSVSSEPVQTYTVAVGGDGDESESALAIANHLGTDHMTLPLPEIDALGVASGSSSLFDEPFADPSAIPTSMLCAATREYVPIALGGDGADELLGGYNRHKVARGVTAQLRNLPPPIRRGLANGLRIVGPGAWDRIGRMLPGRTPALGTKLHKLAGTLDAPDALSAYLALVLQWDPRILMVEPPSEQPNGPERLLGGSSLDELLLADQTTTLPDNMMVKVDRASDAVGLEVRAPFLAHNFVEFTWRLPEHAKVRDGRGKWIIRKLLERHVPQELWDRPKVGFDPPLADWLRGPLKEWAGDLLGSSRIKRQGLLKPEPIRSALEDHWAGRRNNDYLLWTVLMLQSWLEETFETKGT